MTDLFSAPGPPTEETAPPVPKAEGEEGRGEVGGGGGGEEGCGGEESRKGAEDHSRKNLSGAQAFADTETTDDQAFLIDDEQVIVDDRF